MLGSVREMGNYTGDFESLRQHAVPRWYDDAKFGIFVHWFASSIPAFAPVTDDPFTLAREQGERVAFTESPYAEWYLNSLQAEGSSVQHHHAATYGDKPYDDFVGDFFTAAAGWQPAVWADLFAASGAKYCVMGTKHHDGALLWPSAIPNPHKGPTWTSTRDIVGDCADAVRAAGLRFGVYYSGGLDWTFEGLGIDGWAALFKAIPQDDIYHAYADAHYRELIDRYEPDVLWNDIGYPRFGEGAADLHAHFYNGNPDGVINDRFDFVGVARGTSHADFSTPEYTTAPAIGSKKFEVCRGMGTSFGYNELEDESTYLDAPALIRMLVNIVADGGNLLLNVGPMASGEIPFAQQQRLMAIGRWLHVNGSAIYGTRPLESSKLSTSNGADVRLTVGADGAKYAIVLGRPDSRNLVISGLPPGEVSLLGYTGALERRGDVVVLPVRPADQPAFTLHIV